MMRNYNSTEEYAFHFVFTLIFCSIITCGLTATNNIFVNFGDTATIKCFNPASANHNNDYYVTLSYSSPPGLEDHELMRYKPGTDNKKPFGADSQHESRLTILKSGEARLVTVKLSDEGIYRCVAHAYALPRPEYIVTNVTVQVPPNVEVKKLIDPLVAGTSWKDAAVCSAYQGKPAARVIWKSTNFGVNQTIKVENEVTGETTVASTLEIQPFKFYNKQVFSCEVSHPALTQKEIIYIALNVTYPPNMPFIVADNNNENLICEADGNPPVTYTWVLPQGAPSRTSMGPIVPIYLPSDPSHANDTYHCTVANGLGSPMTTSVTRSVALAVVTLVPTVNVGVVVGAIFGGLAVCGIILVLLYFFLIRKFRKEDKGPYCPPPAALSEPTSGYSGPKHTKESFSELHGTGPSVKKRANRADSSSSDSDGEEDNDVDLEVDPATTLIEPAASFDSGEEAAPSSRSSSSFKAQLHRPGSSASWKSRPEHPPQKQDENSPAPASRPTQRYDLPPTDVADHRVPNEAEAAKGGMGDYSIKGRKRQAPLIPHLEKEPQRRRSNPQQYEAKYSEIDHSAYRQGSSKRRPPYEVSVEYAQIRHSRSHAV